MGAVNPPLASGAAIFVFSGLAVLVAAGSDPVPGFVDVGPAWGLVHPTRSGSAQKVHIRESLGQGLCFTDYDDDSDPDLLVLNGGRGVTRGDAPALEPWHFYENRGGRFADVTAAVGLAVRSWGLGCAVGDVDSDGHDDLFVTTAGGPNLLFRNRGDRRFEDWTARAGVGAPGLSASAAFGDLDRDGDLDLFVTRYLDESRPPSPEGCLWKGIAVMCGPKGFPPLDALLYLNRGDGTFVEASRRAGIAGRPGYGLGVVLLDVEDDGDTDIFVANDSSASHLFLNRGNATFQEAGLRAGVAYSEDGASQAGMGVDAGDLDGDGLPDLVKTNFSDDIHNFFRNEGGAAFAEWSHRSGLAAASFSRLGWAVLLEDLDLDADLDLFVVNGHVYPQVDGRDTNTSYRQAMQLLFNDGAGRFTERAERVGEVFRRRIAGRAAAAADVDGDGDLDLAVTRDGEPPLLLENRLTARGASWITVRLEGTRSNREGIGARVELVAAGRRQVREMRRSRGYLASGEAVLVFGLGTAEVVDRLDIRWPSGMRESRSALAVRRGYVFTEPAATRDHSTFPSSRRVTVSR
jgi:hypothetical protein